MLSQFTGRLMRGDKKVMLWSVRGLINQNMRSFGSAFDAFNEDTVLEN
jgi:hypothetical protein